MSNHPSIHPSMSPLLPAVAVDRCWARLRVPLMPPPPTPTTTTTTTMLLPVTAVVSSTSTRPGTRTRGARRVPNRTVRPCGCTHQQNGRGRCGESEPCPDKPCPVLSCTTTIAWTTRPPNSCGRHDSLDTRARARSRGPPPASCGRRWAAAAVPRTQYVPPPFLSRPRELQYFVHAMHRVSCSAATLTKGKRRRTTWQACTHKAQGTKHSSRRPTRPPGPRQRSTAAAAHDAQSALRSCRPARAQRPAYARVTNQTARAEVEE